MRLRGNSGRTAFFALAFLFALAALLPLRLAVSWLGLDVRGLAAREAAGSVWLGALPDAQLGGVPLGDVTAGLRFWPLLVGRARIDLERTAGAPLEGAVTATRHGFGIDDATGAVAAAGAAGLPIEGLELDDVSARFAGGLCRSASGRVRARLAGPLAPLLPGGVAGEARCDGAALLLPLRSQSGAEGLDLRLLANGRYKADLIVRSADPAVAAALAAAGFRPAGGGYRMALEGEF